MVFVSDMGHLPMLLATEVPGAPTAVPAIAFTIGRPLVLDGKSLSLKTPHALFTEPPSWKLPPCWREHTVPEGASQDAGGEKSSAVLPSVDPAP